VEKLLPLHHHKKESLLLIPQRQTPKRTARKVRQNQRGNREAAQRTQRLQVAVVAPRQNKENYEVRRGRPHDFVGGADPLRSRLLNVHHRVDA